MPKLQKYKPQVFGVLLDTFMLYPWFATELDFAPAKTFFYYPSDGGGGLPNGCEIILQKVDIPIAMSKFAQRQVKEIHNIDSEYIPHAIDHNIYYPKNKDECKAKFGLQGKFVVGVVARNQGRKMLDRTIKSFALFAKDRPDAVLFMHSDPVDAAAVFNMQLLIKRYNLENKVVFSGMRFFEGFDYKDMVNVYNAMDVFFLTTSGEGFGIPTVEAMSCFPYDTGLETTTNINKVHIRDYSGEMIMIKAESREILCTPEHPIFTNRGWVNAKNLLTTDILYTKYASCQMEEGRIGAVAEFLGNTNENGNFKFVSTSHLSEHSSEGLKESWIGEAEKEFYPIIKSEYDSGRMGISCWNNRWGGDNNNSSALLQNNIKTEDNGCQYQIAFDELAHGEDSSRSCEQEENSAETSKSILLESGRFENITHPDKIKTLSYLKEATCWNFDFIHPEKIEFEHKRQLHKRRLRMLAEDKEIKSERIIELSKENYSGKVYNVSTHAGIYFANGILVHNCEVPVVVTDYTTGYELVKEEIECGYLVRLSGVEEIDNTARMEEIDYQAMNGTITGSWTVERGIMDVKDGAEKLSLLYNNPGTRVRFGKNGRKKVLKYYTWDVVIPQWVDVIKRLSK